MTIPRESMQAEVVLTSTGSIAKAIEHLIAATKTSIDAALHRFNSQRLARALENAHKRGVSIRLLTDRSKFEKSEATRNLLTNSPVPFRITYGRDGASSKMHHKFALLDERLVMTGSYNWTFASEELNHENILILRDPKVIEAYRLEFEKLWSASEDPVSHASGL